MLPYKLILVNTKIETELHVASFLTEEAAKSYGMAEVAIAEWSSPRMWHTYRIETEE